MLSTSKKFCFLRQTHFPNLKLSTTDLCFKFSDSSRSSFSAIDVLQLLRSAIAAWQKLQMF